MSIPALSGLPSEPVHSGISNMTGAARQRPCSFLGSGAMHLLVGVGVPVRERYGGRIVDLPHAVAVGDETLGDFSLGGRHLVCCGV